MGTYTTLGADLTLSDETPEEVERVFEHLSRQEELDSEVVAEPFDHPFFECRRWTYVGLEMATPSLLYIHMLDGDWDGPFDPEEEFEHLQSGAEFDERRFQTLTAIKSYDSELRKFLDWVRPYLDEGKAARQVEGDYEPDVGILRDGEWDVTEGRSYREIHGWL